MIEKFKIILIYIILGLDGVPRLSDTSCLVLIVLKVSGSLFEYLILKYIEIQF